MSVTRERERARRRERSEKILAEDTANRLLGRRHWWVRCGGNMGEFVCVYCQKLRTRGDELTLYGCSPNYDDLGLDP